MLLEKLLNEILAELINIKHQISSLKDGQIRLEQKIDGVYASVVRMI